MRKASRSVVVVLLACAACAAILILWLQRIGCRRPPTDTSRGSAVTEAPDAPELGLGIVMVWIPPGTFLMGSAQDEWARQADEVPQRQVTIRRGFSISAHEFTQKQWQTVMGSNPSRFRGENLPVEMISYDDAAACCAKLSARTRRRVRLPTETEWEYACRARTTTSFAFGDTLGSNQASCGSDLGPGAPGPRAEPRGTAAVGSYRPNAWGLYDMHGNVWEWCTDIYTTAPPGERKDNKNDTSSPGQYRVVRGGGWLSGPGDCRSASRDGFRSDTRCDFVGFRVVVDE